MKYTTEDIANFKREVCPECVACAHCTDKDDHWFGSCPKFFNWKIGYVSWVAEELKWQREHPEENEAKCKKHAEYAKRVKEQIKVSKKRKNK